MREKDTFYVFATGNRRAGVLPIRCSKDLYHWTRCGSVFETLPAWATQEIPATRGLWAPDISFYNGKYHLYYSVSDIRQEQLRHRTGHQPHARSEQSRLQMGR